MKNLKQIQLTFFVYIFLSLSFVISCHALESYDLKPLFTLKTGRGIDEFLFAFAPAPFSGVKAPLCPVGTKILVDNTGDFYLLKERTNIVKINSNGEVIGEISEPKPFTIPMEMRLDGEDNLYVKFRNDTNIVDEFRYAVAKFNNQGEFLHWIGDGKGYKCIFFGVQINGSVSLQSCGSDAVPDQFQRYDLDGRFIGLFTHRGITHKDTVDAKEGTYLISIGHIFTVGADDNVYVVNDFDLNVKKYIDSRSLTTTEGITPVAERKVFPWIKIGGKPKFEGLDLDNNMYFYFGKWERIELPGFFIDVSHSSDTVKCVKYNFDLNEYDTLLCYTTVEKEGKFIKRKLLRNHAGELYEVVIFFDDPPNVTPEDHVRFYKWVKVNE